MKTITTAATRKLEAAVSTQYLLPATLAVNTVALVALERAGAMPAWIKTAVALFLSF
jgi:hypothetical protein